MRVGEFVDASALRGLLHRALYVALMPMVSTDAAGARVSAVAGRGEDILPSPYATGVRIFALDGIRQFDIGMAGAEVEIMQAASGDDVRAQCRHQRGRQHGDAVLAALAFAHNDLASVDIHILDAQPQAFLDAQACAVEQANDQRIRGTGALDVPQQGLHFGDGEHDWQALRGLGARDAVEPGQGYAEHLAIEEQNGVHGLILCARADVAIERERREIGFDLGCAHVGRVAFAVKENEALDPMAIGFLGAERIMFDPDRRAHPVKQPRLLNDWR